MSNKDRIEEVIEKTEGFTLSTKTSFASNNTSALIGDLEGITKEVAKGGGIAFAGSVVGKVTGLGLHILLGRVLGAAAYGLYVLGTSLISIAQASATLGLRNGVVRFCATDREDGNTAHVKGTILGALAISLVSSVSIAALLFSFSDSISQGFFSEPSLASVIRVLALALPFYVLMGIVASFAQAFQRIDYQQGVQNILRPLANLTLVILAFLLGLQLNGALYAFLFSGVLSAGMGFYFLWRIFPDILPPIRPVYRNRSLLRYSLPLFLAGFAYLLMQQVDRIMLGYFGNAPDVGVYNAASVIALQLVIILNAFNPIFAPIIARLIGQHRMESLDGIYKITTRWIFSLTLPLFLGLVFFSKEIIGLFGNQFEQGWMILIILGFTQLTSASTGPSGTIMYMGGKQDLSFILGISALGLNIALNAWLIPLYGVLGAAIATCSSIVMVQILTVLAVRKLFSISPYDIKYWKPLLAGVLWILLAGIFNMTFKMDGYMWLLYLFALEAFYVLLIWTLGFAPEDQIVIDAVRRKLMSR